MCVLMLFYMFKGIGVDGVKLKEKSDIGMNQGEVDVGLVKLEGKK